MSGLVKPNFIMAFLPALSALAVLHRRHTNWRWLCLSFALPAIAVLAWQYDVAYSRNTEGAGVMLAPLLAIGFHSPTDVVTLGCWSAVAVLRAARFALCGSIFFWHVASGIQHLYSTWLA